MTAAQRDASMAIPQYKSATLHVSMVFALLACVLSAATHAQSPSSSDTRVSLGLGVALGYTCGAGKGLCVTSVQVEDFASRAGVESGDILHRVGDAEVNDIAQLQAALRNGKAGERLAVSARRGDKELVLYANVLASDLRPAAKSPAMAEPTPAPPFEIVQPTSFEALRASVANRDDAISLDDDVLTIVHRDARDAVVLGGSLQIPMARAPGTDIWYLQLKRRDWERAFFSYQFAASRATTMEREPMSEYRGPLAPTLNRAPTLKGRIVIRTISSKYLNEDRAVSVYLPPVERRPLRVLFMTDGQVMERFARVVEPLILSGVIEPIAIVGVHASTAAGTRPGIDGRSQEYVSFVAPEIAARHLQFFIDEVLPSMTREFRFSDRREDRAIFGFSNGAAFVTTAAARHGDRFSHALAFSFNLPEIERAKRDAPTYHFAAGELEPYFLAATRKAHEQLSTSGTSSNLRIYMSGHDLLMWQLALCEYLPGIFSIR